MEEGNQDIIVKGRGVNNVQVLEGIKLFNDTRINFIKSLVILFEFTSGFDGGEGNLIDGVLFDVNLLTFVEDFPINLNVGVFFELSLDNDLLALRSRRIFNLSDIFMLGLMNFVFSSILFSLN